jgi:hypothetical protein
MELREHELKEFNGWFESSGKRHQIIFDEVCHEDGHLCAEAVTDRAANIFSSGRVRLFALPSYTLLNPTVSRPVCLGVRHASATHDEIFITVRLLQV